MSKRSDKLVDLFFEEVPYSEETMTAKARVVSRLSEMSEKLPFSSIAENYHSLEKLAVLAGYSPEDARRWANSAGVLDSKGATGRFRACRWIAYFVALLFSLTFTILLWTIYYAITFDSLYFVALTLFLLGSGGIILLFVAYSKSVKKTASSPAEKT